MENSENQREKYKHSREMQNDFYDNMLPAAKAQLFRRLADSCIYHMEKSGKIITPKETDIQGDYD